MDQYCSTAAEDLSQYVNVNIYFYKPSYSLLKKNPFFLDTESIQASQKCPTFYILSNSYLWLPLKAFKI